MCSSRELQGLASETDKGYVPIAIPPAFGGSGESPPLSSPLVAAIGNIPAVAIPRTLPSVENTGFSS